MRKILQIMAAVASMTALASSAKADCFYHTANNASDSSRGVCEGKILALRVDHTANVLFIDTDGDETAALSGCKAGAIQIPAGNPLFTSYLSLLLAAQLSQKTVYLRLETGSTTCSVGYAVLNS
jgi:hypothetical protein